MIGCACIATSGSPQPGNGLRVHGGFALDAENNDGSNGMTDYKSIADRLVERGIARKGRLSQSYYLHGWDDDCIGLYEEKFCHDWRVAGACMQRLCQISVTKNRTQDMITEVSVKDWHGNQGTAADYNFPLAIILAYLEATDGE